ncbi:MAG: zinc ribbon domain-containing protein [Thermomicrobiaceae bacterium]
MYCGQCGTHNHEEAGHCETCGAPLLITAGGRTCGQCGASVGDHDRFCTSCGALVSDTAATPGYDAADDFGELNIDDIQLEELPDWLQGMAPEHQTLGSPPSDQPSPDDLPDWLRESPSNQSHSSPSPAPERSAPPPAPAPDSRDHQPADQFSLVSDDDLPDWLKALSDEDDDTPVATPQPAPVSASAPDRPVTAVANLFEVPAVSRAWLHQGRSVDPSQVTSARQEFSPLEAVSGAQAAAAEPSSIWDAAPVEHGADDESTRQFDVVDQSNPLAGRGQLIARIVILVLLVLVALVLAYVLLLG